jgi:hypothetical protein
MLHDLSNCLQQPRRGNSARLAGTTTADTQAAQDSHEEMKAAVQWLRHGAPRADVIPQREPGTCEWMCDNEQYQQWLRTESRKCLWIHGIPGKTGQPHCDQRD